MSEKAGALKMVWSNRNRQEVDMLDQEKQELLNLLALFVSRTPIPLKLHATFQTQYVCPLCSGSVTMSDLLEPSFAEIAEALHEPNCKWYRASELVSELT